MLSWRVNSGLTGKTSICPSPTVEAGPQDKDLAGIVVDDEDARVRGSWRHDNKEKPYVGGGYLHDQNGGKGARWAWFDAELTPGRYEVRSPARPDRIEPRG